MTFAPHDPPSIKLGKSTLDEVSALAFGNELIAAVCDGGVQMVGWPKLRRIGKPKRGVRGVAFSPDTASLAMAQGDTAKVALGVARTFPGTGHPVNAVAFSPDGARVAAAGHGRVHVYDIASGKELAAFVAFDRPVERVTWSSDGAQLVARARSELAWFDASTGERLGAAGDLADETCDVAALPDGRFVTALDDAALGVWDGSPSPPRRIDTDGLARSLAVSPTLVAIEDRKLRVLLLTPALEPLDILEGCINQIHSIAISRDGSVVVAGDGNRLAAWART